MEHISEPLQSLFTWYDGVVNEFKHETEIIKNLEKQLDLSREVCNFFENRVRELVKENERLQVKRDYIADSLKISEKASEHKLSVAQARIRVLEGEIQDKDDNFKFLQGLIQNQLKRELEIKEGFDLMRAQIRTLEQERDEALDEAEKYKNTFREIKWHANNNV